MGVATGLTGDDRQMAGATHAFSGGKLRRLLPRIGFLDLFGDADGEIEGGGRLASGDAGLDAVAGAGHEGGQLPLKRLALDDLHALPFDRPLLEAEDVSALALVIEREVGVFLEDADLADLVAADAAGGEVGDTAVLEPDPDVGDVLTPAQDGDADRVDADDRNIELRFPFIIFTFSTILTFSTCFTLFISFIGSLVRSLFGFFNGIMSF